MATEDLVIWMWQYRSFGLTRRPRQSLEKDVSIRKSETVGGGGGFTTGGSRPSYAPMRIHSMQDSVDTKIKSSTAG